MKKIPIILLTILFTVLGATPASAMPVLYDWGIDVDGTVYEIFPDIYLPPTVDGEITAVSGFGMFTPAGNPYGYDVPNALGSLAVTFNPGAAGDYYIASFFDIEIDEWDNTYYNESGAFGGSETFGQFGFIDNDAGDIAFLMGWDFTLTAEEQAVATFLISDVLPGSGFFLSQTDDDTAETVYLTSTLDIQPVPEPATMVLLGTGLMGLCAAGRKRLKK